MTEKRYTIEVVINEKGVGVHEKANALVMGDLRLIVSVLEEYKLRMTHAIIALQQETDLKDKKPND